MTMYEIALEYTKRGLRVIPIAPNSKIPPKGFSLEKASHTALSPEELAHWFQSDDMNIGALMRPSGLLLVDIDAYKRPEELTQLAEELDSTTHLKALTARQGVHYFYKTTQGRDTQSVIAQGIDTKSKGYAVLPPSKVNGKPYQWIEDGEPGIPPAFVLRRLAGDSEDSIIPTKPEATTLLSQVIANGFTPGKHNEELRELAALLSRAMTSENEQFKKEVLVSILKPLDDRDPSPQQAHGNFYPTLKSAWKYEVSKKVEKPLEVSGPEASSLDDLGAMEDAYGSYKLTYLVDQWLPENSILLLAAPPESYKTWLLLDMAISLAFGDKDRKGFMGQFEVPNQRTPVIVIQQEDFPGQVYQRVRTIMAQKLKDVTWDFHETETGWYIDHPAFAPLYFHNLAKFRVDDPQAVANLEGWIKETDAKAVFIDPLYTIGPNENYFMDIVPFFSEFKRLRNVYGTAFVIAHHNRKSGGEGREQVFGSTLLSAASEGVILITKNPDTQELYISRSGKFFPGKISYRLDFDIDTEAGRYVVHVGEDEDAAGKYDGPILRLLTELGPMTQKQLAEEMGMEQPNMSRTLTRLVKSGKIAKDKRKYMIGVSTDGF